LQKWGESFQHILLSFLFISSQLILYCSFFLLVFTNRIIKLFLKLIPRLSKWHLSFLRLKLNQFIETVTSGILLKDFIPLSILCYKIYKMTALLLRKISSNFFKNVLSTPCDSGSWKAHWAVFDDPFFVVDTRAGVEPGLLG